MSTSRSLFDLLDKTGSIHGNAQVEQHQSDILDAMHVSIKNKTKPNIKKYVGSLNLSKLRVLESFFKNIDVALVDKTFDPVTASQINNFLSRLKRAINEALAAKSAAEEKLKLDIRARPLAEIKGILDDSLDEYETKLSDLIGLKSSDPVKRKIFNELAAKARARAKRARPPRIIDPIDVTNAISFVFTDDIPELEKAAEKIGFSGSEVRELMTNLAAQEDEVANLLHEVSDTIKLLDILHQETSPYEKLIAFDMERAVVEMKEEKISGMQQTTRSTPTKEKVEKKKGDSQPEPQEKEKSLQTPALKENAIVLSIDGIRLMDPKKEFIIEDRKTQPHSSQQIREPSLLTTGIFINLKREDDLSTEDKISFDFEDAITECMLYQAELAERIWASIGDAMVEEIEFEESQVIEEEKKAVSDLREIERVVLEKNQELTIKKVQIKELKNEIIQFQTDKKKPTAGAFFDKSLTKPDQKRILTKTESELKVIEIAAAAASKAASEAEESKAKATENLQRVRGRLRGLRETISLKSGSKVKFFEKSNLLGKNPEEIDALLERSLRKKSDKPLDPIELAQMKKSLRRDVVRYRRADELMQKIHGTALADKATKITSYRAELKKEKTFAREFQEFISVELGKAKKTGFRSLREADQAYKIKISNTHRKLVIQEFTAEIEKINKKYGTHPIAENRVTFLTSSIHSLKRKGSESMTYGELLKIVQDAQSAIPSTRFFSRSAGKDNMLAKLKSVILKDLVKLVRGRTVARSPKKKTHASAVDLFSRKKV